MSRSVELLVGIMLLAMGVLVLAADPLTRWLAGMGITAELWRYWPVLIVALSAFFIVPAFFGHQDRRVRAGMIVPGAVLAAMGGVLLYASVGERWGDWSYLWTLLPFSIGVGLYLAGWIADAPAFKWIGSGIAAGGVIAFLVFAEAFGGQTFRVIGAVAILALGAALVAGGLAERLSRK
ncbi:MAG: hypothetical protein M3295_02495, partial [Chloroflexota bacterium]|nr:hypothetical protein [Chloroflexota bacterium]